MSSNSRTTPLAHIRMHTSCDLCGDGMTANEKFVVLIGNWDSTSYQVGIIVPRYPVGDHGASSRVAFTSWWLCRASICRDCDSSPGAATLHPDCLQLFMRSCAPRDALDRLWYAATWAATLPGIQRLRLPKSSATFSSMFAIAAQKCNLPQIKILPREIRDLVQELSEPHLLCRYVVVLETAGQLSSGPSEPLVSVPMNQISSWQRGFSPKTVGEATPSSSTIRCVIDFLGLKKIERLPGRPLFERGRRDDMAFIVEKEDAFRETVAQFKSGLGRLKLGESDRGDQHLHLWDTPTPPDLEGCLIQPERIASCMHFATIDTDATMGITFLIAMDKIMAVHCHTKKAISAEMTVEQLPELFRRGMVWAYVPLPRAEKLVAFGPLILGGTDGDWTVGNRRCFLLRTSLAGDVIIGRGRLADIMSFLLSKGTPTTLVYRVQYARPISFISPYYDDDYVEEPIVTSYSPPAVDDCPYPDWHSSYADLENICWVQVFLDRHGRYCRGLLLSYENGAQRALGQCRLYVDQYQTFMKPMTFCFKRIEVDESGAKPRTTVHFDGDLVHSHGDNDSWICFSMVGTLGFYFSEPGEKTWLSVYQNNPITAIE